MEAAKCPSVTRCFSALILAIGLLSAVPQAHAQADAAIEQSRLYRDTSAPTGVGVDANGSALPAAEATNSSDDSFGAQMILKNQEKLQPFVLSGGASLLYTSNVALTRSGTRDDVFAVADAGVAWTPRLPNNLEASIGAHASIFRYDRTSALDFESLGFGVGLSWNPPMLRGASVFARYDFTELLNRSGNEILMDHTLTLGAQKAFVFGRSHALTIGAVGTVGISDPYAAQRDQLGAFIGYHLQLTRSFDADLLYRPAVHFYNASGRTDFNQVLSCNFRYRLTRWADLTASFSYGANRSDEAVFDYNVLTTGVTAAVDVRF